MKKCKKSLMNKL